MCHSHEEGERSSSWLSIQPVTSNFPRFLSGCLIRTTLFNVTFVSHPASWRVSLLVSSIHSLPHSPPTFKEVSLSPDVWFGCDELHSHKSYNLSRYRGPFSSTNTLKSFPLELLSIHSPSSLYLDWECSQVFLLYPQGITNPVNCNDGCPYILCSAFCLFI